MLTLRFALTFATFLALTPGLLAQDADTTGIISKKFTPGHTPPVKITLSGFSGEVAEVLEFDLTVMGFANVANGDAQFLVAGKNADRVEGQVTDRVSKAVMLSKAYSGGTLRRQAHALADDIALALTGRKGIAQTKIAYKNDTGSTSEIFVADFDGANGRSVTRDGSVVAAPAWAPGLKALYYTSYKLGNPYIFKQDLGTGEREVIARHPGLNTSAAVSPDGRHVAMILSKSGSPDVYVCDANGGNLKQLTTTPEDESSPCWSPDGKWVCFATRSRSTRHLAKVLATGGPMQRISTGGVSSPSEPDWSPDGQWIVFTSQMGGFEICVVPAAGGTATVLVSGEDPSWGANSRTVIFVKRGGGSAHLSLLDVPTKQVKEIRKLSAKNSQPSWAR